jgi:hypothetical protein
VGCQSSAVVSFRFPMLVSGDMVLWQVTAIKSSEMCIASGGYVQLGPSDWRMCQAKFVESTGGRESEYC